MGSGKPAVFREPAENTCRRPPVPADAVLAVSVSGKAFAAWKIDLLHAIIGQNEGAAYSSA
ncbi:MAG TPA: hypothetical protein DCF42_02475 [Lachnospiraceae bacterium]|nr:hypothetical protein [Lachnospiraceae bacterium]